MRLLLLSLLVCPAWVAPQASASAPSAVAIYSRYLAALDKDSLDAISEAVGQFRALFSGQPPAENSIMVSHLNCLPLGNTPMITMVERRLADCHA